MKYYQIVFSPTGGTERVARAITQNWSQIDTIDLCTADTNYSDIAFDKNSLVLIAMPSFGGVAPQLALDRLAMFKGNGAKCAVVAVYGNRAYEDTLVQMEDYAQNAGFQVIDHTKSPQVLSLQALPERLTKVNAYPVCDVCPFVRFTPERSVVINFSFVVSALVISAVINIIQKVIMYLGSLTARV